ncbi:MAG TPA: DUF559 domain-containing protein [Polyangiaceae bacterium]|jgi:very-short-patch-repair endonuclease
MRLRTDTPSLFVLHTFARAMRKRPTRSEALLWAQLRGNKLGAHFRRQHPLGAYVVDFYCATRRLVVEVDGAVHDSPEARARDAARQAELERFHGVRFVRLRAALVERDVLGAIAVIRARL